LNIVILSSIPWDFLWQRPQQIASRLANNGDNVLFFQGPIVLSTSLLKRPVEGEGKIFLVKSVSKNLKVASLFFFPFSGKGDFFTRKLALFNYNMILRNCNFKPDAAIFCSPFFNSLLEPLRSKGVPIVYDCLDDFSAFHSTVSILERLNAEKYLTDRSSVVIAASKILYERLRKINSNCYYVPNAADFEIFNKATRNYQRPVEIENLRYPIIGYIGAVFRWVDIELLCKLSEAHPEYSILLIGPVHFGLDDLKKRKNIRILGSKKFDLLPRYLSFMDVCLIPFTINKLTVASNPIKLYEYLAAGKPVVSTALPDVQINASDIVYIGKNHEDFIRKVEMAVEETRHKDSALIAKRINFAKVNSWDARVQTIKKLITPFVK
jgi:O-antigen biosynthesis protein